jgi:hypothetical protein
MSATRRGFAAVHTALDRPRLWRVTAALAALLLCGLSLASAQGSLMILAHRPPAVPRGATALPAWAGRCTQGRPRGDRKRLAYCARIEGRVIDSTHGPGPRETHVAVLGGFHIVLVRLPEGAPTPSWGTHIVAIGPLFRARDGQREVQAFWLEPR